MISEKKAFLKTINKLTVFVSVFLLLTFSSQIAFADASLSKMRIGQSTDKTRVVFDLMPAYKYQVSELSNPSRLVIDFFNTTNNLTFSRKHITDLRLFKIRVSENGKRTRVVLDLHKTPSYKSFLLAKNAQGKERLVIDLMDKKTVVANQQSIKKENKLNKKRQVKNNDSKNKKAQLLVKKVNQPNIQATQIAPKLSSEQKKINVASNQKTAKAALLPKSASNKASPLVEMDSQVKTTQKLLTQSTQTNKATQELLNKNSEVLQKSSELIVAIDAGHGGKDSGAIGHNNVYEKHVTLMMAKELKKVIDKQPGMKAVLTRDKDIFLRLSQRVKIAKQKQADIFISVHADAFHDNSVRGGSVYVLSERGASSTMARLLARSENAALEDISLTKLDKDVAFALSDLSREANSKASRKLAKTVLREMRKTVKMHKDSVQSAGFAVLKSIDMPSLLIETAFISNPYEAKNLMSRSFQKKMASAIVDGLNEYAKEIAPKQRWGDSLYVEYQVQRGDTLSQIAESYQVSTKALKKLNKIKNANALYVGKKLKIPVSDSLVVGL